MLRVQPLHFGVLVVIVLLVVVPLILVLAAVFGRADGLIPWHDSWPKR